MDLPPVYNPAEVEARWYVEWEKNGFFRPIPNSKQGPFTIVIPPPNVTGILHMGHALNNTLQDVLIRFKRMQGYTALWVPGTDHAGIATQNVVERELAKQKTTRHSLGRAEFVKRVWAWKEQYGSTIVQQLKRLGSSCDWSRERFTMDEGLSRAVQQVFLTLYEKGLIYRGYDLVNWCPRCQTALSDEEVQHEEVKGHLYYIRYPLAEGEGSRVKGEGVVVATTRPETLLGDVAVAVHPEDERYRGMKDQTLLLPILRRPLKIIADSTVDREFGTGAVKVTPAHDPADFMLGQRHRLPAIPVMLSDGKMNDQAGPYAGLDRFECRKRILKDLVAQNLLVKTEDHISAVGHCYRCRTVVEPTLSPQWFVKMAPLAKLGIEAVEKDGLRFFPERWAKVYLDWLRNIRDWCISRQIWWGHRIPAWYCSRCYPAYVEKQRQATLSGSGAMDPKAAGIDVGPQSPKSCQACGGTTFTQDEDVLDTWFSSWLWPFSTLGWPDETQDLNTYYPTSVLVTAQDIIFFWVARMVMAGKFFLKQIPFKDVYIHGIIRVEGGKKMSKSLGNIIDPLDVIDRMGADALRFSLSHMASEGQDLYLSEAKFLLGRNFANKLWNAARLILEKSGEGTMEPVAFNPRFMTLADRWILSRFQRVVEEVTKELEAYHFNSAARLLYGFFWHEFCDWYLEIAKLQSQNTNAIALQILERFLRLLHPFMPFITEELWQKMNRHCQERSDEAIPIARYEIASPQKTGLAMTGRSPSTLMTAPWPEPNQAWIDPVAEEAFAALQEVITEVRNIRATFRVPIKQAVSLLVQAKEGSDLLTQHEPIIQRLGTVGDLKIEAKISRPAGSVAAHIGNWDLIVPLSGLVDLQVERKRLEKEVADLRVRAENKRSRLSDATFRSKAPADVIAEEEELLKKLELELSKWTESLKQMGSDPF